MLLVIMLVSAVATGVGEIVGGDWTASPTKPSSWVW